MVTQDPPHCSTCSFNNLQALYQLNIEAKKYADTASKAYENGEKARVRRHSLRKEALYSYKQSILETLVTAGCVDQVEHHTIHTSDYYCLYVGEFSFHSPVAEWDQQPGSIATPPKELESFEATAANRDDQLTERDALTRLCETFGTPNDHLSVPFIPDDSNSSFVGWSYLPGAIEEGDRVSESHRQDSQPRHQFAVDDEFETTIGHCRICDRYQAWLPPLYDRSPISEREVYDVEVEGEIREGVRPRRLFEDWKILVESLDEPLPDVTGQVGDNAGETYETPVSFDIGDIIEIDVGGDSGPFFFRVDEAYISNNEVTCTLAPVGPTESESIRPVNAFIDDVVAVHESPPMTE